MVPFYGYYPYAPPAYSYGTRGVWYYCPSCQVVIRVYLGVGRVETSRVRYQAENPGILDQLDPEDSAALEVEDPGIY